MLGIETHEEGRLVEDVVATLQEGGLTHEIFSWDQVSGVMEHTQVGVADDKITLLDKPKSLSERIRLDDLAGTLKLLLNDSETPQILILKDFHPFLESSDIVRLLRTLVVHYKANHRTVLMVSPQLKVPLELNRDFTMMDYDLPTRNDHKALLEGFVRTNVNTEAGFENLVFHPEVLSQASESLMGLTANQAENAISLAVTRGAPMVELLGDDLVKALFREKVAQLRQGTLEYLDPAKQPSIGGLGPLREWARKRKYEFSEDARKEGLPYARGVLLTGVPGCGKTLMASEFARVFGMPLYRLDIGRLFASKVGETEALTREVIRQMDSLGAACILVD